jgi:TRAP-type mannitol/chloroaromatic compound transport system permease small subunit
MKTAIKNNPVSVGYYFVVVLILIAFGQFAFNGICQIVDWLTATAPAHLSDAQMLKSFQRL